MASTTSSTSPQISDQLAQRIEAHKEEVARLRAELGDPQAALFRFMLEHFDLEALIPDPQSPGDKQSSLWEDDDDCDAR